jgi:dipeptidyl aminopeptidase/acylaminoacyl peptidase
LRKLEVDDLFRLQQLGRYFGGPFGFSPDGKTLAYVLQRPKATASLHKQDFLFGNDRADIWLVDLLDGRPRKLTDGIADGSGYWAPAWSPDGEHLAMISTKGGNVTLWVWQRATGNLRQLTQQAVHIYEPLPLPYRWISPRTILCPVLPKGEKPIEMTIEMRAAQRAMEAWPKAWKGQETTASVLQSGVPMDLSDRSQGQLLLIDVVDGSTKVLETGLTQELNLSPGKRWVAFLQAVAPYQPEPDVALDFGISYRFTARVTSIEGDVIGAVPLEVSHDVVSGSLRWSADGAELAFIGYGEDRDTAPRIYSFGPADGSVRSWGSGKLDPAPAVRQKPQLHWSFQGELLVYAARANRLGRTGTEARRDWWVVDRDGGERCLTNGMKKPPEELLAENGHRSFVGLADGNLWRIRPDGAIENLTENFAPELTDLGWPASPYTGDRQTVSTAGAEFSQVIASTQSGESTYYLVDLPTNSVQELPKPAPKASVSGYHPARENVLFNTSDRTGTYLWSHHRPSRSLNMVLEMNTFLQEIASGEFRQIEYRSLDGEELKGWLILSPDHQPGKRYPLVTWVYPGMVWRASPTRLDEISRPFALNLQILAANGYVVLYPSIPLKPEGEADDPMFKLPSGVLPAVERAVELGIADPERLFLMGQSFGGYAVYGLITQTNRFKAAVALAGFADLISLYGTFEPRQRYDEDAHEQLFMPASFESAWLRMGSPPWKDLGRYLRNSPVFHVDHVQTPLMIVQGDMDYIPIQQGEEFFMGLYRLGKRAEFVRYWGEGHLLQSPENIKDMWRRVLAWFEEFANARAHMRHDSYTEANSNL